MTTSRSNTSVTAEKPIAARASRHFTRCVAWFLQFDQIEFIRGPLAQRAERRAFNPGVGGSSPSRPTTELQV